MREVARCLSKVIAEDINFDQELEKKYGEMERDCVVVEDDAFSEVIERGIARALSTPADPGATEWCAFSNVIADPELAGAIEELGQELPDAVRYFPMETSKWTQDGREPPSYDHFLKPWLEIQREEARISLSSERYRDYLDIEEIEQYGYYGWSFRYLEPSFLRALDLAIERSPDAGGIWSSLTKSQKYSLNHLARHNYGPSFSEEKLATPEEIANVLTEPRYRWLREIYDDSGPGSYWGKKTERTVEEMQRAECWFDRSGLLTGERRQWSDLHTHAVYELACEAGQPLQPGIAKHLELDLITKARLSGDRLDTWRELEALRLLAPAAARQSPLCCWSTAIFHLSGQYFEERWKMRDRLLATLHQNMKDAGGSNAIREAHGRRLAALLQGWEDAGGSFAPLVHDERKSYGGAYQAIADPLSAWCDAREKKSPPITKSLRSPRALAEYTYELVEAKHARRAYLKSSSKLQWGGSEIALEDGPPHPPLPEKERAVEAMAERVRKNDTSTGKPR